MAPLDPRLPSLDRPSVSRLAASLAGPLAGSCELSAYRLAGGTALSWALGHRRSDDLDFFTRIPRHLDPAEQARIATALRALDSAARIDASQPETIHGSVLGCKLSFFGIGGEWLSEPVRVREGIGLATEEEIAAMKLIAVSTRSAKKDFYDLHALAGRGYSAQGMFSALRRMYPDEIDLGVGQHITRSLTDFSDAELDPEPIVLDGTTWREARGSAERLARDLGAHLLTLRRSGLIR